MNNVEYEIKIVSCKQHKSTFVDHRSLLKDDDGNVNVIYGGLFFNEKFLGRVRVCETRYGFYETHAAMVERAQGIGLGSKLYACTIAHAIKQNIEVRSSTHPTLQAHRVWEGKTLNEQFLIKRVGKRYKILEEK